MVYVTPIKDFEKKFKHACITISRLQGLIWKKSLAK
jgi:hypothetical protein